MCIVRTRRAQSRAHCARSAHVVGAVARTASWSRACRARSQCRSHAQPVQVARSACAGRPHNAQVVGACRDLSPLPSPRLGRDIISRSRPPGQLSHVATSIPCRDLPSTQLKPPRSRPQKWGCDTNFHRAGRTMSRHQIGVVTPLRPIQVATPKPGRDPPGGYSMSRHQFYVATSFLPQWTFQVATLKSKSRPAFVPLTERPCRDPKPWSQRQTTTRQPEPCRDINSMSRHHGQCLLPRHQYRSSAQPGHDFHLWSRPHVQPNQVATS